MTTTLRTWFDEFTARTTEVPDTIVFGASSRYYSSDADEWTDLVPAENTVLQFKDLRDELLDRSFDDGYGGNETRDLCAWSNSWVLLSYDYDGSEGLVWVPRHPTDHQPVRPGGG